MSLLPFCGPAGATDGATLDKFLPELAAFCRVAEAGGFNAAAQTFGMGASTMSRSVVRLETALRVKLFERTTRHVSLTDEGKSLLESSAPLVKQLTATMQALHQSSESRTGLLRISSAAAFGRRYVTPMINRFQNTNPEIAIELHLEDRLINLVDESVDLCVRGGRLDDSQLIARRLTSVPMYVCGSPDYLAFRGRPLVPGDLLTHHCIRFRFRGTQQWFLWEFSRNEDFFTIDIPGRLTLDDIEAACSSAVDGLGLAQLPGYIAVPEIRAGRLVPVLLDYVDKSRAFYLCYLRRSPIQPLRLRLLIECLTKHLGSVTDFQLSEKELEIYQ